ncbi:hypothetical protein [Streptomyces turgidiscabies]|uniref:hypothetical protein n=1 Tax=Streptomyces turgidiscabies TaxID=85558 RepID=UPI00358E368E
MDIHSRRVVGWSMADHMRSDLDADVIEAAVATRGGSVDGVVFHSDRGTHPIHVRRIRFRVPKARYSQLYGAGRVQRRPEPGSTNQGELQEAVPGVTGLTSRCHRGSRRQPGRPQHDG